jgi:hypothetical protein
MTVTVIVLYFYCTIGATKSMGVTSQLELLLHAAHIYQVNTKTNFAGHGAGSKKRGFKKALGSRRALFSLRLGLRVNE